MPELLIAYIPSSTLESAQEIALHLLERKLIACANVVASTSMYWWKGATPTEQEHILIVKTLPEKLQSLEDEVNKIHPSQAPCILKLCARANEQYYHWVSHELSSGEQP